MMELLVGMVVASIFTAALLEFMISGTSNFTSQRTHSEALRDGQGAADRFSRDLRQAVSPDGVIEPLAQVTSTSVTFYVDTRRDPAATTPIPSLVRYSVTSTGEFVREEQRPTGLVAPFTYSGTWSVPDVLVTGVANASGPAVFSAYRNGDAVTPLGAAIATPVGTGSLALVATIQVRLQIAQKTGAADTITEITTDATLRNHVLR